MKLRFVVVIFFFACALTFKSGAVAAARRTNVAILDFGETETGQRAASKLSTALVSGARAGMAVLDRAQSRAAARGIGYSGSLNMTLAEARDLGAAIGCDFFVTGNAQVLRRSSSAAPVYYEAYASIFIVSARTGRLVMWDHPSIEAAMSEQAEDRKSTRLNSSHANISYA